MEGHHGQALYSLNGLRETSGSFRRSLLMLLKSIEVIKFRAACGCWDKPLQGVHIADIC